VSDLERLSTSAFRAMYGARALDLGGGVTAFRVPEEPSCAMLNTVQGLGVETAATEATLDAAIVAMEGTTFYVAVAPGAQPAELTDWIVARGLEPGWGWMRFRRGPEDPPPVGSSLDVREVRNEDEAEAFARVARAAFELDQSLDPWFASLAFVPGWTAWIGWDGDEPASTGALYVEEDAAYLGWGATLPEQRGKGGQGALFAARIRRAQELGCTLLVTETGELRDDLPSSSYRNILRFGFREDHVVANWVGGAWPGSGNTRLATARQ
jgi:GNAT superfamily N-acetyltransferase